MRELTFTAVCGVLLACAASVARAQDGSAAWAPQVLGTQVNVIGQRLAPFPALYSGPMSLIADGDRSISHTYGIYLGARIASALEGYLDVEMARGNGISHASGLAGITNGDVLRQGTADLGNGPYVARAFLRYSHALSTARDTAPRAQDQLPGSIATTRLQVDAGKLAVSDYMDVNRYANSTRTQFMNWSLINNTAWDFAADTRGYTNGVTAAWITPQWTIRLGSFQMPLRANGNKFDPELDRARGDNAEVTFNLLPAGGVIRMLAYMNHARMGDYREAIDLARGTGHPPNIVDDDQPGRVKKGVAVNVEQPLADSGETGLFARWGQDDGATESFVFSEVDEHASVGIQIAGSHWTRTDDRVAIAYVRHGLSAVHREYLADGGVGFLLGDGALDYGNEQIVEAYYKAQVGSNAQISPDVQYIRNPGYNRDRGPAWVSSLRINLRY
jgi:high affinity Mn2+ porin